MDLYTFIMDYLGGTYISQCMAANPLDAMSVWIRNLEIDEIEGFSEKDKNEIIETNFIDEEPILLNGLKNVWHFLVTTPKGTGYINFVRTIA